MANAITDFGRAMAINRAGDAIAAWLVGQGWTVGTLQAELDQGVSIAVEALQAIPADQMQKARPMIAAALALLTSDDYWAILNRVATHEAVYDHAALLATSAYYQRHWIPSLEAARVWLTGTPGHGRGSP